jgi:hypothetical protein
VPRVHLAGRGQPRSIRDLNGGLTAEGQLIRLIGKGTVERDDPHTFETAPAVSPATKDAATIMAAQPGLGAGRSAPRIGSASQVLALQRAAGNRAVSQLIAARRRVTTTPSRVLQRARGSDDWQAGYGEGLAGQPNMPGPRAGEAADDYTEGWLQGSHEAESKQASSTPPAASTTPSPAVPRQGTVTPAAPHQTPVMTLTDKLEHSITATGRHLGPEFVQQIEELLSPQSLAIMATFIASQFVGLGEAADTAGFLMLVAKIGADAVTVAGDLIDFVELTVSAKGDDDFDNAGAKLAQAVMLVGVDTLLVFLAAKKGEERGGGGDEKGGGESKDGNKSGVGDKSKDSDTGKADETAKAAARQKRLAELSDDPDKGGATLGSVAEAVDALKLEESGDVRAPVRRANGKTNPRENGADFVDGENGLWDHKFAKSDRGFDPVKFLDKIQQNDIANGEKIMLNHEGLSAVDRAALLKEIDTRGLLGWFKGIPPL